MKLNIFIFKNPHSSPAQFAPQRTPIVAPPFFSALPHEKISEKIIFQQTQKLGVEAIINTVNPEDVPSEVYGDYVLFFDENTYITKRYIINVIHTFALCEDMSVVCGPVINVMDSAEPIWFTSHIKQEFDSYYIQSTRERLGLDITTDFVNYPRITNCSFDVRAYNAVGGYQPILNKRVGAIKQNNIFLRSIASQKYMMYFSQLSAKQYITKEDLLDDNVSKVFYEKGYTDALKNIGDTSEAIFEKFINEPETLDYSSVKWLTFDESIKEKDKKVYGEKLVIFKGLYNLGFIEGLLGKIII